MERLKIDEIIDFYEKKVKKLEKNIDIKYLETAKMSKEVRKYWRHRQAVEYLKKFKKYKQSEESGMILKLPAPLNEVESFSLDEKTVWHKLPCKVGDTVYLIKNSEKIVERKADMMFIGVLWEEFGKEWFPTREKAEAKLKEMRGSNND